jgi:hypothetical protein
MRFLVTAAKTIRAAGLKSDPRAKPTDQPAGTKSGQDWETLGRDLGRAVRKLKDGGRPGT